MSDTRVRIRRLLPLIALAVAAVVVAIIITPQRRSGPPLDPASTDPRGTRGLVEVLRELGRDVQVVEPSATGQAATTLVLIDNLTADERDTLSERVSAGATVVVADPRSPLVPRVTGETTLLERRLDRGCALAALESVQRVRATGAPVYEVPDDATGCFPAEAGSWMVVQPQGDGHLIALGDATFLTNGMLGEEDHALLAASLLAPRADRSVAIVEPWFREPAFGIDALIDLIGTPVRAFVVQLVIAFLAVAAWRARRLGLPIVEQPPVRLASADLVVAVGDLLRRNGAIATAAGLVRERLRQRLVRWMALGSDASAEQIASRAADLPGVDRADVEEILAEVEPGNDEQLVVLAQRAHEVERAVMTTRGTNNEESRVH